MTDPEEYALELFRDYVMVERSHVQALRLPVKDEDDELGNIFIEGALTEARCARLDIANIIRVIRGQSPKVFKCSLDGDLEAAKPIEERDTTT